MIADIVLFVHFCIVIFIFSGFFLVPIGYWRGWIWIRNIRLRVCHLILMALVTLETLFGITCPLTFIENNLRAMQQPESFVGYWIGQMIYWDLSTRFFLILYSLALGWTLLMWKLFPISYNQKTTP